MTPAPATTTDLFDHLVNRLATCRARERLLAAVLRRALEDDRELGSLSPHTTQYARRLLGLPAAEKKEQRRG